jgi:hypothetical protein
MFLFALNKVHLTFISNLTFMFLFVLHKVHLIFYFQSKVQIYCLSGVSGALHIAGLQWYNGVNGYVEPNCPSMAICFDSGRCQIMRTELDESEFVLLLPWILKYRQYKF